MAGDNNTRSRQKEIPSTLLHVLNELIMAEGFDQSKPFVIELDLRKGSLNGRR